MGYMGIEQDLINLVLNVIILLGRFEHWPAVADAAMQKEARSRHSSLEDSNVAVD